MLQLIVGACFAGIVCVTYYERKLTAIQTDRLSNLEGRLTIVEDEVILSLEVPEPDDMDRHLKILKDEGLITDDTEIRTEGIVIPLKREPEWIG